MMTYYELRGEQTIRPVEVEKETALFVYVKGTRCAKRGIYYNYFTTIEEAHAFITERANKKIAELERRIACFEKDIQAQKNLIQKYEI